MSRATHSTATHHVEPYQGQDAHRLCLPNGDQVWVANQGAQVLSWIAQGRERLFLSAKSQAGGHAIRGGVPVCWPQFNQRGSLPKHGLARLATWQWAHTECNASAAQLVFEWRDSDDTRAVWPHAFVARVTVALSEAGLQVTLDVHNTDTQPLTFTGALHTYLGVDDIALVDLQGLGGLQEWNAVADSVAVAEDPIYFDGEFDRVYDVPHGPRRLRLQDGQGVLLIEQSDTWGQTVVWNPGEERCAALPDMPTDGFAHMLCVEAAQVYTPIEVPAGTTWSGWQRLMVS